MWSVCNPRNDGTLDECAQLGKSLSRLSQPTILTILAEANEPLHGYVIVQRAAFSPMFGGKKPDPTGVYRTLKIMEEDGLLTSEWDMPKAGQAKRAYTMTDTGISTLRRWIDSLACYQLTIGELREQASTALGIDVPEAPCCHGGQAANEAAAE
jgi:DNA-binding PadR family transcriptional regulator